MKESRGQALQKQSSVPEPKGIGIPKEVETADVGVL